MSKRGKTEMCRRKSENRDVPPFVLFATTIEGDDDGNLKLGGAIAEMTFSNSHHPVDELPYLLSECHEKGMTEYLFLMFVTEGYARRGDISEMTDEEKNPPRGVLEKDFAENPNTNVCEGIIGTVFAPSGETVTATCFYKYDDNGLPVYEEAEYVYSDGGDDRAQGRLADVFTAFMKYCEAWNDLNEGLEAIKKSTNPLIGEKSSFDIEEMPNFATVWQVFSDELPNKKKVADKMKKQVAEFMSRAFLMKVTQECWQAINEKSEKGELDIGAFMTKMETVMSGDDDNEKVKFIEAICSEYSVSAQALMLAMGTNKVPNDISGLVG